MHTNFNPSPPPSPPQSQPDARPNSALPHTMSSSSWMKDIQDRVKKASTDMNATLQPRVMHARRTLEDQLSAMTLKPSPEIFAEDERLLSATTQLDRLRSHIRHVSSAVASYRSKLLDLARAERALATALSPAEPPAHVSEERFSVAAALCTAQTTSANANSRFALDMSTPMADLARNFEEAYLAKITPLKRKYLAQKGDYLRTVRQMSVTTDEQRKHNLQQLAAAAAPLWKATSDMLMAEIQSLSSYASTTLSEWSLNVAQAQAETSERAATAFQPAARLAEKVQSS